MVPLLSGLQTELRPLLGSLEFGETLIPVQCPETW